ncbi:MAG: phage tail sheath C-terminal domain-containing protein [Bacteroidia bacterium]
MYKTPGVYIEEIAKFPPSVAPVATAIPAFIGYVERVVQSDGRDLTDQAVRLTSMLEFEQLYGGAYAPDSYTVTVDTTAGNSVTAAGVTGGQRFYLYDCLRHYFDNGGGPCYIVAVDTYRTAGIVNTISRTVLEGGLPVLDKEDEPTLLLIPDGVSLIDTGNPDLAGFGTMQASMLAHCARHQDRFSILDVMEGRTAPGLLDDPAGDFRDNIGVNNLSYGAVYYPWLNTIYSTSISLRQLVIQDETDTPMNQAALEALSSTASVSALVTTLFTRRGDTDAVAAIGGTDAMGFLPLRNRFDAAVATFRASATRTNFGGILGFLRGLANGFQALDAASLQDDFAGAVDRAATQTDLQTAISNLVRIEKNAAVMAELMLPGDGSRATTNVDSDYAPLNTTAWIAGATLVSLVPDGNTTIDFTGATTIATRGERVLAFPAFINLVNSLLATAETLFNDALFYEQQAETQLFASHPVFQQINTRLQAELRLLPASGAIAGAYATVDRERGVWKAPANVSLRSVIGPAFRIDEATQGDLNVHGSGKSINAIRAFAGKGTLIWGARTLAGNDNEWRYVPVRRFFIFAEESIMKATEPFVFEPNDANTWVKVRAMIENFLTLQWRAGALAGASPQEAFYVRVGLDQTMTAQDILEGRMIVEIGMAVVRPAEFIILRFSHKMQES